MLDVSEEQTVYHGFTVCTMNKHTTRVLVTVGKTEHNHKCLKSLNVQTETGLKYNHHEVLHISVYFKFKCTLDVQPD